MRGMTVAIVAGVVVVLAAAAVYLRPRPEAAPENPVAVRPQSTRPRVSERSARVEERLGQLREEYQRRQGGAPAIEPNRREVPTMSAEQRAAIERADAPLDDLDLEDPEEMHELKQILLTNPDPEERVGAVLMLTGEEGPESMRMLLEAMSDPDAEVRLAVVEALGDRVEEISAETLVPALRDPDPEVRFEAVSILGDMETPEAMQLVRQATQDEDEDVRALAEGIEDMAEEDEFDDFDEDDEVVPPPTVRR